MCVVFKKFARQVVFFVIYLYLIRKHIPYLKRNLKRVLELDRSRRQVWENQERETEALTSRVLWLVCSLHLKVSFVRQTHLLRACPCNFNVSAKDTAIPASNNVLSRKIGVTDSQEYPFFYSNIPHEENVLEHLADGPCVKGALVAFILSLQHCNYNGVITV